PAAEPVAEPRIEAAPAVVAPPAPAPEVHLPPVAVAQDAPAPEYAAIPADQPAPARRWQPTRFHAVDRERLGEAGALPGAGGASVQQEEFRIVKRQLLLQAEDLRRQGGGGAAQRVMICSPHPAEGKTFCAVNLALSIAAEKDSEVLLVDLDLARLSVLEMLGLPREPGLMDALADPAIDLRDCVIATDIPGLSVLPGGRATALDTEYLASARAHRLLDTLTEDAPNRIVLFDTPPALVASLPAEVAKLVGQVVLVVMADKTSASAINDAASLLAGCPNIQLLLNGVRFSPSGRRFGSYYGYQG
ncbi:MAG TPA: AAA family ATPase, partial [Novosphingobium sp.]|nr:AAA family ATPase [Novosphingobium sp.]